jgi:hypothetical protein
MGHREDRDSECTNGINAHCGGRACGAFMSGSGTALGSVETLLSRDRPQLALPLNVHQLDRHRGPTRDSLHVAIFEFIEIFYNRQRRHSHPGNPSTAEYERTWHEQRSQAQVTSP